MFYHEMNEFYYKYLLKYASAFIKTYVMMEKNITSGAAYSKANSFPSMSVKLICLISVAFANTLIPLYTRET